MKPNYLNFSTKWRLLAAFLLVGFGSNMFAQTLTIGDITDSSGATSDNSLCEESSACKSVELTYAPGGYSSTFTLFIDAPDGSSIELPGLSTGGTVNFCPTTGSQVDLFVEQSASSPTIYLSSSELEERSFSFSNLISSDGATGTITNTDADYTFEMFAVEHINTPADTIVNLALSTNANCIDEYNFGAHTYDNTGTYPCADALDFVLITDIESTPASEQLSSLSFPMTISSSTTLSLPIGLHTVYYSYQTDNSDSGNFTQHINVVSNQGIACNDGVQVTMDLSCNAVVTPDMILEGDYCYESYTLTLEDEDGNVLNHNSTIGGVAINTPGDYIVSVTDPFGNECWGTISAEDKISNSLAGCESFEIYCSQEDTRPGATIINELASSSVTPTSYSIAAGDTETYTFVFDKTAEEGSTVTDVNLSLKVAATLVNTIEATLIAPDGSSYVVLDLFEEGSSCDHSDIDLFLDDDAINSHSLLLGTNCGEGLFAYSGIYRSMSSNLTNINGENVNDTNGNAVWQLQIENHGSTDAIELQDVSIEIEYNEGTIPYPLFNRYTDNGDLIQPIWIASSIEENTYEVRFNNNCSDLTAKYEDVKTNLECWGEYLQGYERRWTFTDVNGRSRNCTQEFKMRRFMLDDITFPPNYDDLKYPAFSCMSTLTDAERIEIMNTYNVFVPEIVQLDENGHPAAVEGVAGSINVPFGDVCDNFKYLYEDTVLPLCGSTYKVIRRWTVTDWCTGDVRHHDQVIKVKDDMPVLKVCPPDTLVYYTDATRCATNVILDPNGLFESIQGDIQYIYDCSNYTLEVEFLRGVNGESFPSDLTAFESAIRNANGTYTLPDIEKGYAWVRYIFTDECGNSAQVDNNGISFDDCRFEIQVVDNVAPTPVCIEETVAVFGVDGCARVPAISFDNHSWDNCGVEDYRVRLANTNNPFVSELEFCCQNFKCGEETMVELMVFDGTLTDEVIFSNMSNVGAGINFSSCMVNIAFQDKTAPTILAKPEDKYLDCDAEIANITELKALFPASEFEIFDNLDNCQNLVPELVGGSFPVKSSDACTGGTVSFTWEVTDICGNKTSTVTRVTFAGAEALDFNTIVLPREHILIEGCSDYDPANPISPEELAQLANYTPATPRVSDIVCSSTAITFEDTPFFNVDDEGVCTKVIRKWTIIDWCQHDANTGQGVYYYSQIIKFKDDNAPDVKRNYTLNCATDLLYDSDANSCKPFVKLILSASDDCGEDSDLNWSVLVKDCGSGPVLGTQTFSSNDISGYYTHGDIEVTATVVDNCGNATTEVFTVNIPDCKPPTPYCLGEIVTVTLKADLDTEIWAKDFDYGSYDDFAPIYNCPTCPSAGNAALEHYFIDPVTGQYTPVLTLDCSDIPDGQEVTLTEIKVYVVDPNGAPGYDSDWCEVTLILQDNTNDICPDDADGSSRIAGTVSLPDDRPLANANVTIASDQPEYPKTQATAQNGSYAFDNNTVNKTYKITSSKNDDIKNGVSTLDILMIQRHILDIAPFTTPYQYIAADANNSKSVSAADIAAIRGLILEKYTTFQNGQESWRFVDSDYEFSNVNQAFPFDESIDISLQGPLSNQDFVAVKIGDLTNDVSNNDSQIVAPRSANTLALNIEEKVMEAGDVVTLDVTAENFEAILGMQYTLELSDNVEFLGFEQGVVDMDDQYAGFTHLEDNMITVSWNTVQPLTAKANDVLFSILVKVIDDTKVSETVAISSEITDSEAYDANLEPMNVDLNVLGGEVVEGYTLHQNVPNPFNNETVIGFTLPKQADVSITVFDLNGKTVAQFNDTYTEGYNSIKFSASQLGVTGVLYYQMSTDEYTGTRKMLIAQ